MKVLWKKLRIAALICCVTFLFMGTAFASPQALNLNGISGGLARPVSIAASGESLWVLTNGALYRVSLAEASYGESTLVYPDLCPNSRIAYRDGLLYVLSYEEQALSLYCMEQEMQACNPCGAPLNCEAFFISQDEQRYVDLAAFAPLTDTSWAALLWTSAERSILLYGDSERGEIREVAVPSVVSIAPADEASIYASLSSGELRRVNLDTGEQATLAQLEQPACCLAATEDGACLYLADSLQVYQYMESTGIQAYDRSPLSGQAAWFPSCVAGDRYVLGDYSSLFVVEQPDTSLPLLTIASLEEKQILQDFEANHDVRVLSLPTSMYFDAEKLMQDMITQNNAYDIYWIDVSTGCLSVLMQKGYYVPLDASSTLVSAMDAMDPNLTALLKQDGHYAAFPKTATAHMLCINTKTMEEFGLTEEDLPRTFSEFLPWLAAQYEKSQDLGRVVWDTQRSLRHSAFTLLLNMYIKQCEKDHVAPDFISHDFPELLAQIDQYFMDTTPLPAPRMVNGELELPLLSQQDMGDMLSVSNRWIPLPLVLSEGLEPMYDIQLQVYLINPYSEHQEAALAYLETVSSYLDMEKAVACLEPAKIYTKAETSMLLSDTPIAPVERPEYAAEYAAYEEERNRLIASLDFLEPQALKDAQLKIKDINSSLGFLEQLRWYVSPKDIERMESYRPFFHVSGEATFFASVTDPISTYTSQYVDGIISTQEMLQLLQRLARMVQLESL